MTTLIGIPVGIVVQRAVEKTWFAAHPEDPPKLVADRSAKWSDALAWAALSAAGLAATEIVTRRVAEAGFRAITGSEPPPPKPTRREKKLQKQLAKSVGETARAAGDTTAAPAPA
ncbi:MAG: DUF4235 domain-containing protein [Jatrophihabitans sp.]|uniref:DUF4235 domain-containing protein n=1 Tax=Jatrophihabitans sp. TaxID=1932789 RepID=UPI003F7DF48D